jgi:suppressor for copper-sensitivity B
MVLLAIAGPIATIAAAIALSTLALLLWFGRDIGRIAVPFALAAIAAAVIAPVLLARTPQAIVSSSASWHTFNEARIAEAVSQGKAVFVDVTADWCLTCQLNKRQVLDDKKIAARLNSDKVIAMRADWTRPSDDITAYLKRFGRYGIPFNVVYGPGAPQGIVLPELLDIAALNQALDRAGANGAAAQR